MEREKSIASALNSARSCNIFYSSTQNDIRIVIEDYFVKEYDHEEVYSDTDSDESSDATSDPDTSAHPTPGTSRDIPMQGASASGSTSQKTGEESSDDGGGDDEPLIEATDGSRISKEIGVLTSDVDVERRRVESFQCGCKRLATSKKSSTGDASCYSQFSSDEVLNMRMEMAELTEAEKDLCILGMLASTTMKRSEVTEHRTASQRHARKQQKTFYTLNSRTVCRETFKFLLGISQNKLTALLKHYKERGLEPRKKKSGGRVGKTALTAEDTERVVKYLQTYAEDHALVLPGRVPGFKKSDIKLLPSSDTKRVIWRRYSDAALAAGWRAVKRTSFLRIWQRYLPFIVVARPMTDLCWQCRKNNLKIQRSANLSDEQKQTILQDHQEHLQTVQAERTAYNAMIRQAKEVVAATNIRQLEPNPPNSQPFTMHYSFDYAQQVHYPSDPMQPGPMYFLVPRKCGIFGVNCEGLPQQINYLIDETVSVSKGSTMVISLLHHFLEHYGVGEQHVELHCDNCSGQNKNKYLLWYLAWRTLLGLHTSISLNFMPAGHTKFAPDWCFGLLKRRFRRSEVSCLADLCSVVESSTERINRAQLVGNEDGAMIVPVFNWQSFLEPVCKPLKGIKSVFHFRFSSASPGTVFHKKTLDGPEETFDLFPNVASATRRLQGMPPVMSAPGLSADRKKYLFQNIRQFVRDDMKDVVCPEYVTSS